MYKVKKWSGTLQKSCSKHCTKMKFSIKDFFSKSLMENFIFYSVHLRYFEALHDMIYIGLHNH